MRCFPGNWNATMCTTAYLCVFRQTVITVGHVRQTVQSHFIWDPSGPLYVAFWIFVFSRCWPFQESFVYIHSFWFHCCFQEWSIYIHRQLLNSFVNVSANTLGLVDLFCVGKGKKGVDLSASSSSAIFCLLLSRPVCGCVQFHFPLSAEMCVDTFLFLILIHKQQKEVKIPLDSLSPRDSAVLRFLLNLHDWIKWRSLQCLGFISKGPYCYRSVSVHFEFTCRSRKFHWDWQIVDRLSGQNYWSSVNIC